MTEQQNKDGALHEVYDFSRYVASDAFKGNHTLWEVSEVKKGLEAALRALPELKARSEHKDYPAELRVVIRGVSHFANAVHFLDMVDNEYVKASFEGWEIRGGYIAGPYPKEEKNPEEVNLDNGEFLHAISSLRTGFVRNLVEHAKTLVDVVDRTEGVDFKAIEPSTPQTCSLDYLAALKHLARTISHVDTKAHIYLTKDASAKKRSEGDLRLRYEPEADHSRNIHLLTKARYPGRVFEMDEAYHAFMESAKNPAFPGIKIKQEGYPADAVLKVTRRADALLAGLRYIKGLKIFEREDKLWEIYTFRPVEGSNVNIGDTAALIAYATIAIAERTHRISQRFDYSK